MVVKFQPFPHPSLPAVPARTSILLLVTPHHSSSLPTLPAPSLLSSLRSALSFSTNPSRSLANATKIQLLACQLSQHFLVEAWVGGTENLKLRGTELSAAHTGMSSSSEHQGSQTVCCDHGGFSCFLLPVGGGKLLAEKQTDRKQPRGTCSSCQGRATHLPCSGGSCRGAPSPSQNLPQNRLPARALCSPTHGGTAPLLQAVPQHSAQHPDAVPASPWTTMAPGMGSSLAHISPPSGFQAAQSV